MSEGHVDRIVLFRVIQKAVGVKLFWFREVSGVVVEAHDGKHNVGAFVECYVTSWDFVGLLALTTQDWYRWVLSKGF